MSTILAPPQIVNTALEDTVVSVEQPCNHIHLNSQHLCLDKHM